MECADISERNVDDFLRHICDRDGFTGLQGCHGDDDHHPRVLLLPQLVLHGEEDMAREAPDRARGLESQAAHDR